MKILVINAGSSSLKFQLIDMENESVIAKGLVERIGTVDPTTDLTYSWKDKKIKEKQLKKSKTHSEAMEMVLDVLVGKDRTDLEVKDDGQHLVGTGVIADLSEIGAVGHRVLHGGEKFTASCLIDDACIAAIKENIPLGPLHNPANLMGIEACQKVLPDVPQVAVFDTAFHQTMPPKAFRYGLPNHYYTDLHMRKYGFHGTSHRFIAARATELFGENKKVIVCHLGNGSSLSAVRGGKCVDTTMGLTPLEGPIMGTRSGTIDPSVVTFMLDKLVEEKLAKGETVDPTKLGTELSTILNKKSGLLGISGKTSDCRYIVEGMENGDERCTLAYKMLVYQIQKLLGSYIAVLGRVDAIVFTAGQGENGPETREAICDGLEELGIKIDLSKNDFRGQDRDITADGAKIKTLVLTTNEELEIARDTYRIVSEQK